MKLFEIINDKERAVLDIIAVEVSLSTYGSFLRSFAVAWQCADPSNKRILFEPWKRLISKYKFREEYADVIKRELDACAIDDKQKRDD